MIPGAVEAVDDHTVRLQPDQAGAVGAGGLLQLSDRDPAPVLQAAVLGQSDRHRAVHALAELAVDDRCILKRITKTTDGKDFKYWGGDVYLDEIHYYNYEADNQLTAFASGDVDTIYAFGIEQFELAQALDGEIVTGTDGADAVLPLPGHQSRRSTT